MQPTYSAFIVTVNGLPCSRTRPSRRNRLPG